MPWHAACILFSLLLGGPLPAPVAGEKDGQRAAAPSKEDWRRDLRYFATELPKRHKNLFHSVSRAEFDRAVADSTPRSHRSRTIRSSSA